MKIFSVFLLSVVLCLNSCGSSKKNQVVAQSKIPKIPEIIGGSVSQIIVAPKSGDSSESVIAYQFYAVPAFSWQDSVNYKIAEFISHSIDMDEDFIYQPLTHEFFSNKLKNFDKTYHEIEDPSENEYESLWFYDASTSIDDRLKNYVQVEQFCSLYTGGAHPNAFTQSNVISKNDGSTLLLSQLVNDVEKFNKIAEKYFKIARDFPPDYKLEEDEDFWFPNKVFQCNNNFSIGEDGITFTFNSYEIAPYVYGATEFTVPMKEIKELLAVDLSRK